MSSEPRIPRPLPPPVVRESTHPIPGAHPGEEGDLRTLILDGFRRLGGDITDMSRDLRDLKREHHERLRAIEHAVFGSTPPPPPPPHDAPVDPNAPPRPKVQPLAAVARASSAEIDTLEGKFLVLDAKVSKVLEVNERQNKAAGVAPVEAPTREKIAAFVFSRAGVNAFVRALTAIGVVLTAAQTVPACGGHAPAPAPVTAPAGAR